MLSEYDQRSLHKHSSNNRIALEKCDTCGCFYCLEIFPSNEIKEWVDKGQTALCPKCEIDSVIPASSTEKFSK